MNEIVQQLIDSVRGVDPVVRVLVAGLAILLETSVLVGLVVPGDTVVLVAGSGVQGVSDFLWLFLAVNAGSLCGESAGFFLGRFFGPRIRRSWLGRRLGERNWLRAERYLGRRGGVAVFLSRFLPVLHSLIPLAAGMAGMRYRSFVLWTLPACVLWSGAYIGLASSVALSFEALAGRLKWAGFGLVGVVVAGLLVAWLAKRLLLKRENRFLSE